MLHWASFKGLILLTVLTLTPANLMGLTLEAKTDGVKVLSSPGKDATSLGTLKKGEALPGKDRKGMFWRVEYGGKEAYISALSVIRKAEEDSALAKAIGQASRESRDLDDVKSARSRSAVMGIRGLSESKDVASAGNVTPNFRMVYTMEDRATDTSKVDRLAELVQLEVANRARARERVD